MNIYYFSGTGQSWQIAKWIQEAFQGRQNNGGEGGELTAIDKNQVPSPASSGARDCPLAIVYPVYGFSLPWLVFKWLLKLPKGRGRHALLFNTRGAIRLWSDSRLLGINGFALWFAAFLLLCKGYRVKCLAVFDLPSNWVTAHPGPSKSSAEMMMSLAKKELDQLMPGIFQGKLVINKRVWWSLPLDIISGFIIGIPYFLYYRIFLAKLFIVSPACNRCGQCSQQCPTASIELKVKPYWRYSCISCMRCLNLCPKQAIYTAHLPVVYPVFSLVCLYVYGFSGAGIIGALLGPVLLAVLFYPVLWYVASKFNIGPYISLSVHWPYYSWWKNKDRK